MFVNCPVCSGEISQDPSQRNRPWCPHCGVDLNQASRDYAPGSPTTDATSAEVEEPAIAVTTCSALRNRRFRAFLPASWNRESGLYVIYIGGQDLLLIKIATTIPSATNMAATGGLIGGLIGGAVAWNGQQKIKQRESMLEGADETTLRKLAEEEKGNFLFCANDLYDVSVDPPSFWGSLFGNKHAALLRLTHPSEGKFAFQLQSQDDVVTATEELSKLLADSMAINVAWSHTSCAFLAK